MSACRYSTCPVHGIPCRSVKIGDCLTLAELDRRIEALMDIASTPTIFVKSEIIAAHPGPRLPSDEDN